MTVQELLEKWRQDCAHATRMSDMRGLALTKLHVDELEAALRDEQDALLTRAQAAEEFGVHPDTLTRHASTGDLPNRGRPGAPKYRRGDVAALRIRRRGSTAPGNDDASLLSFTRRVHARKGKEG